METNKRDQQIDVLRGLAVLSVLMIHVTADYAYADRSSLTYIILNHVNKLFYTAVPVFVALTVFLGLKSGKSRGFKYALGHSLPIVLMYLAWSAVYTAINCLRGGGVPDLKTIVLNYVLQGGACYHLYYIVMLVQLYFVIALLSQLPIKKLKPRFWQPLIVIAVQEAVLYAFIRLIVQRFWFYNTAIFAVFYLVPIMYGIMLAADYSQTLTVFEKYKVLYAAAFFFCIPVNALLYANGSDIFNGDYTAYYMVDSLFRRIFNFGGIPLMFLLAGKLKSFSPLAVLGRHSLGIYFAHPLVLSAADTLFHFNSGSPYKLIFGVGFKSLLLIALSLGFAYVAEKRTLRRLL